MKSKLFLISSLVLIFISTFILKSNSTQLPTKPVLVDTPVVHRPLKDSIKCQKILFIGDSHTCYAGGWQDQLCKMSGMIGTRIAKGGMQTSWMWQNSKNRIDTSFDWCMIWGGANDAASPANADSTIKNIQRIVDLCNSKGVRCVVLTGFNPDVVQITQYNKNQWGFYPPKYRILQAKIKSEIKGAIIVQNWFVDRKDGDCGDFICHLSAKGHNKMALGIYKAVYE